MPVVQIAFLICRAHKEKTAVHFFQQECRVFGAHRQIAVCVQIEIGQNTTRCLLDSFADRRIVDQGGSNPFNGNFRLASEGFRCSTHDLFKSFEDFCPDALIKSADGTLYYGLLWNDVKRGAAMKGCNTDHRGLEWRDIS